MVRFQRDTALSGIWAELTRPEVLVLCPALFLAWLWFGLEGVVLFAATGAPLALLARRPERSAPPQPTRMIDVVTGLPPATVVCDALDQGFFIEEETGRSTACVVVGLDDPQRIRTAFGHNAHEVVLRKVTERLRSVLRDDDILARANGDSFAIAMAPGRRMDLETAIQVAARLKAAVAEPLSIDATTVYVSASVGFCLSGRSPGRTGQSLLAAAEAALMTALRNGPGTIRAYSPDIATATAAHDELQRRVSAALETGEIVAYFQPQLSTDTGDISGFEALARWQHPQRGVLSPSDFLPALLDAGLGERLGEVMLSHALSAMRQWDAAGLDVPGVSVNFSRDELRDPALVSKLKWQLDRFDLTPDRLTIEILETVAAETADDIIVRNIAALSKMGCPVDLDDFGTGHASIASIRRFAVNRIKIDRSYVTQVDTDPSQQRMVAAVLSMADRLGLQTLAEGVETIGEHAMLSQLGCSHVQGFVIARPMPIQTTGE
ncbi:MAG: phosphodiesterase, partial [Albidovulum sp.]|uniref:putative bifunctional diguanylate cyclase/phosphodiesterase n=1 Tax=Albidovulum sp. TaxID=1872424 RepID=UPI003CB3FAA4